MALAGGAAPKPKALALYAKVTSKTSDETAQSWVAFLNTQVWQLCATTHIHVWKCADLCYRLDGLPVAAKRESAVSKGQGICAPAKWALFTKKASKSFFYAHFYWKCYWNAIGENELCIFIQKMKFRTKMPCKASWNVCIFCDISIDSSKASIKKQWKTYHFHRKSMKKHENASFFIKT